MKIKTWARNLKLDILALWVAARDKRTPLPAKILAATVAAYALSPIDLIPDFIPIIGYLDDLILVPIGIAIVLKMIPAALMADYRKSAEMIAIKPRSVMAAFVVVTIWFGAAFVVARWFCLSPLDWRSTLIQL